MHMNRNAAHLFLGAIRVRHHQLERSPTPAEVAELLDRSETEVRLQLVFLADLGAVVLVDSAFASHVEIGDQACVEQLPTSEGPALSDDLKDFDRRREVEAERLSHLFDSGEAEREHQQTLDRMDEELARFRREKPRDPFAAE